MAGSLWWVCLCVLSTMCAVVKVLDGTFSGEGKSSGKAANALQWRYLSVFWLVKLCDWLQGPYFYEVYASKVHENGQPFSGTLISSLFVAGFAASLVFGTIISSVTDSVTGRKKACLLCAAFFVASCMSVHSNTLGVLYAGRISGGIASSLMHSAFESWFLTSAVALKKPPTSMSPQVHNAWVSKVFTLQTFGDGVVAVCAGVIANYVSATFGGPLAVFNLAAVVGVTTAIVCALMWSENFGSGDSGTPSLRDLVAAGDVFMTNRAVLLQGLIQSLFEAAMFCFVLLWVPSIQSAASLEGQPAVPTGLLFSCLMVCIMIGSSTYGLAMQRGATTENVAWALIAVAFVALAAPVAVPSLVVTTGGYFVFEAAVGVSFPAFGTIRSQIIPGNCRSAVLAIYRVPLNLLVTGLLLNSERMGTRMSLVCCCCLLAISFVLHGVLRGVLAARRQKQKQ